MTLIKRSGIKSLVLWENKSKIFKPQPESNQQNINLFKTSNGIIAGNGRERFTIAIFLSMLAGLHLIKYIYYFEIGDGQLCRKAY